jgi:hypothetical protein
MQSLSPSLFNVEIGSLVGNDAVPMANDVLRMVCIQFAIQAMLVLSGESMEKFFSTEFLLLIVYIVLGVMLYWLAMRKLVVFT